jgi:NitT/TauT family transport system substrate-binding protein
MLKLHRWVGACVVGMTVLALPVVSEPQAAKTKVAVWVVAANNSAPIFVAKDKGFFEQEGLDVQVSLAPSGPKVIELLHLGEIQFGGGAAAVPILRAIDKGLKLVMVDDNGGYDRRNPQLAALVKKGSPIKTLRDLRGKRVAINAFGTHTHMVMLADVLPAAGLTKTDLTLVELPWSQMAPSVISGAIDVGMVWEPFATNHPPDTEIVSWLKEAIPAGDYPQGGYASAINIVNADFLKKNPAAVEAWRRGYKKGLDFFRQSPREANQIASKYLKLSVDLLEKVPYPIYTQDGSVPVGLVQKAADRMKGLGLIERQVDVSQYVWKPSR